MGQGLTHLTTFQAARAAATEIYEVIDRKTAIDGLSETGVLNDHDLSQQYLSIPLSIK